MYVIIIKYNFNDHGKWWRCLIFVKHKSVIYAMRVICHQNNPKRFGVIKVCVCRFELKCVGFGIVGKLWFKVKIQSF